MESAVFDPFFLVDHLADLLLLGVGRTLLPRTNIVRVEARQRQYSRFVARVPL